MEITLAVSDDQKTVTLTAVSGEGDIANLYMFQNSLTTNTDTNLLSSPGFVDGAITFTSADAASLFDSDGYLNTGYLIAIVTNSAEDDSANAIAIGSKDIDCCIANLIDSPYEELDDALENKKLDKATRAYLSLKSAEVAANNNDLDGAIRYFNVAEDICDNCGCAQGTE